MNRNPHPLSTLAEAQQHVKDVLDLREPGRYMFDPPAYRGPLSIYDKHTARWFFVYPHNDAIETIARITAPALS